MLCWKECLVIFWALVTIVYCSVQTEARNEKIYQTLQEAHNACLTACEGAPPTMALDCYHECRVDELGG